MEQLELPFDDLFAEGMERALLGPRFLSAVPVSTDGTVYEDEREHVPFEVLDENTVAIKCTFFAFSVEASISHIDLHVRAEHLCRIALSNAPLIVPTAATLSADLKITDAKALILAYFK